jgi:hypothetical protein
MSEVQADIQRLKVALQMAELSYSSYAEKLVVCERELAEKLNEIKRLAIEVSTWIGVAKVSLLVAFLSLFINFLFIRHIL